MRISNNKACDVKIAYIGGGSRGWAWTFMTDLALESSMSGTVRLYDLDREAAAKNEIIGNKLSERDDAVGKWNYTAVDSLQEALSGTDFVIISILPGTFEEMDSDVHLPEKYGIYQSVGDTAGPGGIVRALRTIPMFLEIAEAIKKYCPEAWIINYTNPMSLCVKTLYYVFPQVKAFGCCHEVFGTQKVLMHICREKLGAKQISRQDIHVNVLGLNHFTWFDYASYQGTDLMPIYKAYVEEHYDEGFDEPDKNWANSHFDCAHRVKFDLFLRYGLIAAAGDRHLAEFMAGDEYLKNPEAVKRWKYSLTTVKWRKDDLAERLKKSDRLAAGEPMSLEATGEEGIQLIKALCGLARIVSNVNIPNTGRQISNLPENTIVETNAVFEGNAIRPIIAGALSEGLAGLMSPHVQNQEDVLRAAVTCDKKLAFKAFMNDPLVKGRITEEQGKGLFNDMLRNTLKYLPKPWGAMV